ncbi:MAG: CRISPR-associated endonuclease Cas1 [Methylocella sp.]
MPKPRRLAQKIDGNAVFEEATSIDGLSRGWERVWSNQEAAGGDGVSVKNFAFGVQAKLAALSGTLREGHYLPLPLRVTTIPKPAGGLRTLTIPSVRDRVAQSSIALVLTPLLDAEMEESSFGCRPGKSVADAANRVERLRREGFIWTIEADIYDFFDTIPIDPLAARLEASISESPLAELIAIWLEPAAVKGRGLAQGSPLSPLFANLYLDDLDEALAQRGLRIVRYADDFVVLAKDRPLAEAGFDKIEKLLAARGLALDRQKSRLLAYDDTLRFLGHVFVRGWAMQAQDGETPDMMTALRRLAEADEASAAEAAREEEAEGTRAAAGYDRGLRILYVREPGRRLGLKNQSFAVHEAPGAGDDAGRELVAVHHARIDRIEIGPRVETDLETLRHALCCAIPIAFVGGHGAAIGHLAPTLGQHAGRHLAQARHALDPALRLDLARKIVIGRLANERALLRRANQRRGLAFVARAAAILGRVMKRAEAARTIAEVMGFEGVGTKLFWKAWGLLLLHGFVFSDRKRHAAAGPVNIALDFSAWLVARDIGAVLCDAGLHPGFGVLHATADYRDACVFDLMEEFRAGLVESLVLTLINTQALRRDMFAQAPGGGLRLGRAGQDAMIRHFEERCARLVTNPRSGRRVTWRRLIREQAEAYAARIEGRAPYRPYVLDY